MAESQRRERGNKRMLYGVKARTPLLSIRGLDLIKACPIDSMHALDLGVTRKLLNLTFKSSARDRLMIPEVMDIMVTCNVPSEYTRRGRVVEFGRLKASELMHLAKVLGPEIADLLRRNKQ